MYYVIWRDSEVSEYKTKAEMIKRITEEFNDLGHCCLEDFKEEITVIEGNRVEFDVKVALDI